MTDLVAHIREVIDEHAKPDRHDGGGLSCSCGATHLSDHSSHVAQAIVNRLELKRKTPLVAAIGYVAKGWVAAFRRNGTNMRQKPGDIV